VLAIFSISQGVGDVLVPLAAAILGAVVGGLVTGRVTRKLDESRRDHERELEQRRELEIAYWLMEAYSDEMARAIALLIWTKAEGKFPPFGGLLRPLGPEDRLSIMRQLDVDQRLKFFSAELSADLLSLRRTPRSRGSSSALTKPRTDSRDRRSRSRR
jgi:hypothetical protein